MTDTPKMGWDHSLRIAAEEYIRLDAEVHVLYQRGEDDPMTDEFKVKHMAFLIAAERYRELTPPRAILELLSNVGVIS